VHAKKPVMIKPTSLTDEEYDAEWQLFRKTFKQFRYEWESFGGFNYRNANMWHGAGFTPEEAVCGTTLDFLQDWHTILQRWPDR